MLWTSSLDAAPAKDGNDTLWLASAHRFQYQSCSLAHVCAGIRSTHMRSTTSLTPPDPSPMACCLTRPQAHAVSPKSRFLISGRFPSYAILSRSSSVLLTVMRPSLDTSTTPPQLRASSETMHSLSQLQTVMHPSAVNPALPAP